MLLNNRRPLKPAEIKANEQEKIADMAYENYVKKAAAVEEIWKKHSELQLFGDKVLRTIPNNSEGFKKFQLAMAHKEEAREAWQRECSRHGHLLKPEVLFKDEINNNG